MALPYVECEHYQLIEGELVVTGERTPWHQMIERASILTYENLQGAPDIAIEILWEDTRHRDTVVKRRIYERYGVSEYWMIDPDDESVTIVRDGVESRVAEVIATPLLPGFQLSLNEVFAK
jgi:Uma2 family endonuclease